MSSPPPSVAASVRAELRAAELSQEKIGKALGITQEAVSRRFRGRTQWRADELVVISRAFGIPLERLYDSPYTVAQAAS